MDLPTLLALAQNAVDIGQLNAACEFFELALHQSPNNDEVLEAYAETMIHSGGDLVRAEQMLRHAISVNPHEGYVKYVNLAQLCSADEAVQLYRKSFEIAENMLGKSRKKAEKKIIKDAMSTMCCAVAELYLTDLCFEEAAEQHCEMAVNKALEFNDQSVEAHQVQASLRLSQSRPEEALQSLLRALELTHTLGEEYQPSYSSKIELARLLMQVSPDKAFGFLLELLQLCDTNPYVWFLLGECARLRGRYPDGARLLRRARVLLVTPYVSASGGPLPPSSYAEEDREALEEIDQAIALLVEEMGGEAVAAQIPDLDCLNPLELLQPEDEEEDGEDDNVLDEPTWQLQDELD